MQERVSEEGEGGEEGHTKQCSSGGTTGKRREEGRGRKGEVGKEEDGREGERREGEGRVMDGEEEEERGEGEEEDGEGEVLWEVRTGLLPALP